MQEFVVGIKVCYGVELAQITFRTALWARKASRSTEAESKSFGSGFEVVKRSTLTRLCTSKHRILENSCVRGLERIHLFNTRSLLIAQPCLIGSNMHYKVVFYNPRDAVKPVLGKVIFLDLEITPESTAAVATFFIEHEILKKIMTAAISVHDLEWLACLARLL